MVPFPSAAEVCEVAVTRVEPEVYVPPLPGAPVLRAAGAQRDSAPYFDEMGASKVPVGFGRDGQPVFVNFEFVDGSRGAHVSISGVSGIATKTSFAMFLPVPASQHPAQRPPRSPEPRAHRRARTRTTAPARRPATPLPIIARCHGHLTCVSEDKPSEQRESHGTSAPSGSDHRHRVARNPSHTTRVQPAAAPRPGDTNAQPKFGPDGPPG